MQAGFTETCCPVSSFYRYCTTAFSAKHTTYKCMNTLDRFCPHKQACTLAAWYSVLARTRGGHFLHSTHIHDSNSGSPTEAPVAVTIRVKQQLTSQPCPLHKRGKSSQHTLTENRPESTGSCAWYSRALQDAPAWPVVQQCRLRAGCNPGHQERLSLWRC